MPVNMKPDVVLMFTVVVAPRAGAAAMTAAPAAMTAAMRMRLLMKPSEFLGEVVPR